MGQMGSAWQVELAGLTYIGYQWIKGGLVVAIVRLLDMNIEYCTAQGLVCWGEINMEIAQLPSDSALAQLFATGKGENS